jgi:hypothetical protein
MKTLIRILLVVALVGLLCAAVIHISTLAGTTALFGNSLRFLGPTLFVVWVPAILVMNRLTRDFKQRDLWRAALRGCPVWMRRTVWAISGYCWAGFFVLPLLFGGGMDSDANKARSMSGALIPFYLIAAAVHYSALNVDRQDGPARCLNGHTVEPLAKFCSECGAPVSSQPVSNGS